MDPAGVRDSSRRGHVQPREQLALVGLAHDGRFDGEPGALEGGVDLGEWDFEGYPTFYIIDHKGVVRHQDIAASKVAKAVDKLLAEMAEEAGR